MKLKLYIKLGLGIAFLFCPNKGIAQEVANQSIIYNLTDSIKLAMKTNPTVQQALQEIERTRGALLSYASQNNLPQLEYTRTESFSRAIPSKKTIKNTAGVEQVLYRFGQENVTEKEDFRTARTAYVKAMNDTIYNVRTNYLNALLLQKQLRQKRSLLKEYENRLKIKKAEYELGEITLADVIDAELQIITQEISIDNVENDLDQYKMDFLTLIGKDLQDFMLEEESWEAEFNVEEAIRYALDTRIEIRDLSKEIRIQEGIVREALWKVSPDITLTGTEGRFLEQYDLSLTKTSDKISAGLDVTRDPALTSMTGKYRDEWGFSLSVSLPLFEGLNMAGARREEIATLEKSKFEMEAKKDEIRKEIIRAYTIFSKKKDKLIRQNKQMELKKRKWQIIQKLIDLGRSSYYELNTARDDFNSAEESYYNTEREYILAQEGIRKVMGEYYKYMGDYLKYWE
ncbi:MAG: TolC family protein [Candidatus Omnitrophica bacterium]|nr:TolC family protein [Candidatus Omnitrophota bacterium]